MSGEQAGRGIFADHFSKHKATKNAHSEGDEAPKKDFLTSLYEKISQAGSDIAEKLGVSLDPEAYATYGDGHPTHTENRFGSFAPLRFRNAAKWYVDGCGYFWAVSCALEHAQESIWILDWWLSPEMYLRRPPSQHEQYRLDNMLKAAAERGVKVNIIVYKEVEFANPLQSEHTKKHLEGLHENIQVFRHPDHKPHKDDVEETIKEGIKNFSFSDLSEDAAKTLYGAKQDMILYWAHHEKLLIVDGHIAFMGGLDMCFGRWDTNQHPIADAHPGGQQQIMYPGQDFNDARIQDFKGVDHPEQNEVNRFASPRMGWSDCSVCLSGPVVEDLRRHFVERWNFVYEEKYKDMDPKDKTKDYLPLELYPSKRAHPSRPDSFQPSGSRSLESQAGEEQPAEEGESAHDSNKRQDSFNEISRDLDHVRGDVSDFGKGLRARIAGELHNAQDRLHTERAQKKAQAQQEEAAAHGPDSHTLPPTRIGTYARTHGGPAGAQICRSACEWSHGVSLEHSIQNAYKQVISEAEHFIYMENQFFITATGDQQKPFENTVGAAIVERILRAARNDEKFQIIVVIPSVPGFAGDLLDDSALGTRAIMEYQYNSINRGGHSIMELVAKEGYNPMDYIRFYNLRNYDRINATRQMLDQPEEKTKTDEEMANNENTGEAFQETAEKSGTPGRWDTVSECYMLNGDIRNVPWDHEDVDEINQFVSEELYIHSKVLIADDRTVIIGSANMNDRSQLGSHDSEIAVVIQDPTEVQSTMNGKPYPVSKFAASFRRHLHKKHLGLLPPQVCDKPDKNFYPVGVPNHFDFDSAESKIVEDPLSPTFQSLWNSRAHTNTEVFRKLFHAVPDDNVRTWDDYKSFFEHYFKGADEQAADGVTSEQVKEGQEHKIIKKKPALYEWGHVVAEDFPGGATEVKEELAKVKGTLVEMPLMFLCDEDMAKTGLMLNKLTEPIYT